jgi:negative regulator of sigma E activity
MPEFSDEVLMAYVDGELAEHERIRVETALSYDPALERRLHAFRMTRDHLKTAFNKVLYAPVPDHLIRAIERAPVARRSPSRPTKVSSLSGSRRTASRSLPLQQMAAAAAIVGVAFFGWNYLMTSPQGAREEASFDLASFAPEGAAAPQTLAAVLERQSSGVSWEHRKSPVKIQPLLTFSSNDGRYCREFLMSGAVSQVMGLACRSDEGVWSVEALGKVAAITPPDERNASQVAPGQVAAAQGSEDRRISKKVGELKSGDALSIRGEEKALIMNGWKKIAVPE